ncbi:hypothetical protein JXJ21_21920 [candidate division KSB1 bacterium]|nr:hypothetical protein [candidate division KSB1 bacterium]
MWRFLLNYHRKLLFSGTIGFIAFLTFFSDIPFISNQHITRHKREIVKDARKVLKNIGYSTNGFNAYSSFDYGTRSNLNGEFGKHAADTLLTNTLLNGDRWQVYFQHSSQGEAHPEYFYLQFTPAGSLERFIHQPPSRRNWVNVSVEQLKTTAVKIIKSQYANFDASRAKFEHQFIPHEDIAIHEFNWVQFDSALNDSVAFLVRFADARLQEYVVTSGNARTTARNTHHNLSRLQKFVFPLFILLLPWLYLESRRRGHRPKDAPNYGLRLAALFFVIHVAHILNGMNASLFNSETMTVEWERVLMQIIVVDALLQGIIFSSIIYLTWNLGQALYSDRPDDNDLTSFKNILTLNWLTPEVAESFATGFFIAASLLGFITAYAFVVTTVFDGLIDQSLLSNAIDRDIPWLTPAFSGVLSAFFIIIILYFFMFNILKTYLKRSLWAILPILLIMQIAGFDAITFDSPLYNIILRLALGLIVYWIYTKYDLFASFIGLALSAAFLHVVPLLSTSSIFFQTSGISCSILLVSALFVSILGFRRNRLIMYSQTR